MARPKVLAMIMAGGEGKRLYPLTAERSKPAVPFGGRYRIVDFVLSNFVNSEYYSIYLLVQYKSQSLIEHLRKTWMISSITARQFVTVVPPQMRGGPEWFQGTADAVYQNLNLIYRFRPDLVAVFGADHIYRMDVRQMVDYHIGKKADITVAALPVPISQCQDFGVIAADTGGRVLGFEEKPVNPTPLPTDPRRCYASMGNYLFDTNVLVDALEQAHQRKEHDFGHNLLPRLLKTHNVVAYDFSTNRIPCVKPYEEPSYWRDVGSIDAYYSASRDMLGPEPRFDDFNIEWPIYSGKHLAPIARIIGGEIVNSSVGGGSLVKGASVKNSILRREVVLEEDVEIEDSIIMDYTIVGRGSRLKKVIVDRYNLIPPGTVIGHDPKGDQQRFFVSPEGVVVVPTGARERWLEYVY